MESASPDHHGRAVAALVLCGVLWSLAGVLIVFVDWNGVAIWSMRCAICALGIWVIKRPTLRGITRAEWAAAGCAAATTGLFVIANKLTAPANAILIQYSAPVWVALLGQWFLGERARPIDWITIGLVLVGITLFFFDDLTFDHAAGNLVSLAAGVAFAFGAMTLRKATTQGANPLRCLFLGNLLGTVLGCPAWFIGSPPDVEGWLALAALGIVQQTFAYLCYAYAIKRATALEALLVPTIEPILSPLWVALVFGQWPSGWAAVGGAIVVGAVVVRGVLSTTATRAPLHAARDDVREP